MHMDGIDGFYVHAHIYLLYPSIYLSIYLPIYLATYLPGYLAT